MVYLTDLDDACRKSGLTVVEIPGWKTRGRPASSGPFNPRGQVVHHTGSHGTRTRAQEREYVERVLVGGFATLPGPLCQLSLGQETVDGPPVIYVVAAGRANHAGASRARGFMTAGDGNTQAVGWEAINSGYEGWSDAQLDAYHRGVAAVGDHYDWPRSHVLGHGESSTAGKWDPGIDGRLIDMNTFRRAVAAVDLTTNPQEDDMTPKDIFEAVWRTGGKLGSMGKKTDPGYVPEENPALRLSEARVDAQLAKIIARETRARAAGLEAIVKQVAAKQGLNAAAVQKMLDDAVKAELKDLEITLTVDGGKK